MDYFNQRISAEQHLKAPPLTYHHGRVEGQFGGLKLATELHPIRSADMPDRIVGHDATLLPFQPETSSQTTAAKVFHVAEAGSLINVDRLCRTIHMLNYLPLAHENGHLFLHVHPRHILGVKRDHGAYFEEVIFKCGLSPRQVVITVALTPVYDRQLVVLLEGLKNYQIRGYGTAIQFDDKATQAFLERYCIEFLYRITPDFVRLNGSFFAKLTDTDDDLRGKSALLNVIHELDTQFLVEGIEDERDVQRANLLRAELVKGGYYELGISGAPIGAIPQTG